LHAAEKEVEAASVWDHAVAGKLFHEQIQETAPHSSPWRTSRSQFPPKRCPARVSTNFRAYRKAACVQITVGSRACDCISRVVGRKGIYRRPRPRGTLFVSMASAAESFRFTCGSERRAPECSTQRSPGAAPHVGQETEDNCFAVRSFFFMLRWCDRISRKTVPFRTFYALAIGNWRQSPYTRDESTSSAFHADCGKKV
jgi:hypothetical protein